MKKLMFTVLIGLMVSMLGCEYNDHAIVYIKYEVTGDASNVDIIYLDKNREYQTITAVSLPWSYAWKEISYDDNPEFKVDVSVINNDNQDAILNVSDNGCVIYRNNCNTVGCIIELERSFGLLSNVTCL